MYTLLENKVYNLRPACGQRAVLRHLTDFDSIMGPFSSTYLLPDPIAPTDPLLMYSVHGNPPLKYMQVLQLRFLIRIGLR